MRTPRAPSPPHAAGRGVLRKQDASSYCSCTVLLYAWLRLYEWYDSNRLKLYVYMSLLLIDTVGYYIYHSVVRAKYSTAVV